VKLKTLITALTLVATPAFGQARLTGPDVAVGLEQYIGKLIIITNCSVALATNTSAVARCGPVGFIVTMDGIDRETLRFLLTNCAGFAKPPCEGLTMQATPSGTVTDIELRNVKLVQ
jgi:hypothetical protein